MDCVACVVSHDHREGVVPETTESYVVSDLETSQRVVCGNTDVYTALNDTCTFVYL